MVTDWYPTALAILAALWYIGRTPNWTLISSPSLSVFRIYCFVPPLFRWKILAGANIFLISLKKAKFSPTPMPTFGVNFATICQQSKFWLLFDAFIKRSSRAMSCVCCCSRIIFDTQESLDTWRNYHAFCYCSSIKCASVGWAALGRAPNARRNCEPFY